MDNIQITMLICVVLYGHYFTNKFRVNAQGMALVKIKWFRIMSSGGRSVDGVIHSDYEEIKPILSS
jgi:hypothetical protein